MEYIDIFDENNNSIGAIKKKIRRISKNGRNF